MAAIGPAYAWAAVCLSGIPRPFINEHSVRRTRFEVMAHVGSYHRLPGDKNVSESWRRAYRDGWRARRVRIEIAFGDPS